MTKKIFIVEGTTGECGDRHDWQVHAFESEQEAKDLADRLNAWCVEQGCAFDGGRDLDKIRTQGPKPDEDPGFCSDYTGTKYSSYELAFTPRKRK